MKEKVIGGIVLQDQLKKHMIVVYRDRSLCGLNYLICFVKMVLKELMINCHEVLFCLSNHRAATVSSPKMGEEEMFTGERTRYMRNYF